MYQYFIAFRYIKTRLITLFSIAGVAVGVMVLLVVLSVMDGFKKEFKSRLQGTLSDIIISVHTNKVKYEQIEQLIVRKHIGNLPLLIQKDLDKEKIPQNLKSELQKRKLEIPEKSTVFIKKKGEKWQIRDDSEKPVYFLQKENNELQLHQHNPDIKACSPHLAGYVLIATGKYYAPGQVIGIDYEKEKKIGKIGEYLVTKYKAKKMWVEKQLERNVRRFHRKSFSWEVLGGELVSIPKQGTKIFCKKTLTRIPRQISKRTVIKPVTSYVAYIVNDQQKIVYIEDNIFPPSPKQLKKFSSDGHKKWQKYFDVLEDAWEKRNLLAYISRFSPDLDSNTPGLNPKKPLELAHNRKALPLLVGYELMSQLGMRRGHKIELVTAKRAPKNKQLEPVGRKFDIVGGFRSGWQEVDMGVCYAKRSDLKGFIDLSTDVTEVCVSLADPNKALAIKKELYRKLNKKFGNIDDPNAIDSFIVERWQDRRRSLLTAIKLERIVMTIVLFLIVILAITSIMIILILLVTEKTRDIGILKSMGASDNGIRSIFLFNGLFISICGTIIGTILGVVISLRVNWLADRVYEFTGFRVFPRDVYYLDRIPVEISLFSITILVVPTLIFALIVCMIPATKAARMDPVEALRSEFYLLGSIRSFFSNFFGKPRKKKVVDPVRAALGNKAFYGGEKLEHEYIMGPETLRILDGVDLEIQQGEMLAIIGKSGAGKSTFLHLLGLLDTPANGSIYHQGESLNYLPLAKQCYMRNKKIGFIFQFYHLLPEFTALENVLLASMIGHNVKSWKKVEKQMQDRAAKLLEDVGLKDRVQHHPLELSGGERQRVAIARALMNKPSIVLCDEPTGNLDEKNSKAIQDLMWKLNKEKGQTFVFVTHDDKIAKKADRVYQLTHGKLVKVEKE